MQAIDERQQEVPDGLVKASYQVFISKYKLAAGQQVFLAYPQNDVRNSQQFQTTQVEAQITIAMCDFYASHGPQTIQVLLKPHKRVIAASQLDKGKMALPIFGKVGFVACAAPLPDGAFEVKGHGVQDCSFYVKPQAYTIDGDGAIVPFTFVQSTKDKDEANAKIVWKAARADGAGFQFALIQNSAPILPDAEIKLYTPPVKAAKAKAKAMPIDCGVAAKKKQKTDHRE